MKLMDYAYALRAEAGEYMLGSLRDLHEISRFERPAHVVSDDLNGYAHGEFRMYPFMEDREYGATVGAKAVMKLDYGEQELFTVSRSVGTFMAFHFLRMYGQMAAMYTAVEEKFRMKMIREGGDDER